MTAHARHSDPLSSDITVKSIAKDTNLRARILAAALARERLFDAWTDTELTETIEEHTGVRQQRNVIARTRGLMEKEDPPLIERVGMFRIRGRLMMCFRTTAHGRRSQHIEPPQTVWSQLTLPEHQ